MLSTTRRTRIVATIGPATESPAQLDALIAAGMNVARMNFSHGTHNDHARRIADVRAAAARAHRPIAVLQDLQGPKIRTGALVGGQSVHLEPGASLIITIDPVEGTSARVSTTYTHLPLDVAIGDHILVSDGLIDLQVTAVSARDVTTVVIAGGELRQNQGINLPGVARRFGVWIGARCRLCCIVVCAPCGGYATDSRRNRSAWCVGWRHCQNRKA